MDKRIGAQYYTIRESLKTIEDFELACKKIKDIGYKIVQISGTPLGAAEMKEVLDKYGLKVVVTHRSFDDFKSDLGEIISYNKILGCEICGIGVMPDEAKASVSGLNAFIREMNEMAAKIRKEGMYFGYHNHHFEFIKIDGKCIMDRLIEETNPENVVFIVDTYWLQVGGVNPVDYIKKLGSRAAAVHFKDYEAVVSYEQKSTFCEVGKGNLDWDKIIAVCEEVGSKWALVEQDVCVGDPFECLKTSYEYLLTKGFV